MRKLPKSRSVRHHFVKMDGKSLLPLSLSHNKLIKLVRRVNLNDDNSEKDKREVKEMIF